MELPTNDGHHFIKFVENPTSILPLYLREYTEEPNKLSGPFSPKAIDKIKTVFLTLRSTFTLESAIHAMSILQNFHSKIKFHAFANSDQI